MNNTKQLVEYFLNDLNECDMSDWNYIGGFENCKIFKKSQPITNSYEVKMVSIVDDVTMDTFADFNNDYLFRKIWDPFTEDVHVNETTGVVNWETIYPWPLWNREKCLNFEVSDCTLNINDISADVNSCNASDHNRFHYIFETKRWNSVIDGKPCCMFVNQSVNSDKPLQPRTVRVESYWSIIHITANPNKPNSVKVTVQVSDKPGLRIIPEWLINWAMKSALIRAYSALKTGVEMYKSQKASKSFEYLKKTDDSEEMLTINNVIKNFV